MPVAHNRGPSGHRTGGGVLQQAFPRLWQTHYLGWPPIRLFHKNNKNAIRHLYQYETLIDIMAQMDEYVVRNFVFSIAQESHTFTWLAAILREMFS
ncbi:hypothetical protein ACLOJK_014754 [Asimina triloba]